MRHSTIKGRRERKEAKSGDLSGRLVTILAPNSLASEAYRTLRTSLIYTRVDTRPKTIVVTSHGPREGKSTTCANLAVVLAQAGKNTLLLDCDFRNPVVHKIFNLRNLTGIVDVIVDRRSLQEVAHEPLAGLKVATVGYPPPNPSEIAGSRRFAEFMSQMRRDFEYVLIDAPPVGLVADPLVLASQGDGVVLVLDAQNTRKGAVRQAMRSLEGVGARVLGTVMNNVKKARGGYYYGSTYGYNNE
ncbi:CpsD/CapB family tyrosine-protein kinase [soil metagenome]